MLPAPPATTTHNDYFGNIQTFFTRQEPHDCLIVEASSELEVHSIQRPDFSGSPPWETVAESLAGDHSEEGLDAYQFVFGSQRVGAGNSPTTRVGRSLEDGRCWRRFSILCEKYTGISASILRRPRSRLLSRHSSKNAVAFARTSSICRLRACDRWACRPVTSAAICEPCRRLACRI